MKKCGRCKVEKPFSDFHKSKTSKDGHNGRCKQCSKEYNKEWQAKDPDKARESWKRSYKKTYGPEVLLRRKLKTYGITKTEYDELVKSHGGLCGVCGKKKPLQIDHDHGTGSVRGLLCLACNTGLGNFSDDEATLRSAIKYLAPKV